MSGQLKWHKDGNQLVLNKSQESILTIVPDEKYENMWRVKLADGTVSDMSNIERTKEAGMFIGNQIIKK